MADSSDADGQTTTAGALPAPYRHLVEDLAIVLLRLLAVGFLAASLPALAGWAAVAIEPRESLRAHGLPPGAIHAAVAIALWLGAASAAPLLVSRRSRVSRAGAHPDADGLPHRFRAFDPFARQLLVVAFTIVGIVLVVGGLVELASVAGFELAPRNPADNVNRWKRVHGTVWARLAAPIVRVSFGLVLLFGGRGTIAQFRDARAALNSIAPSNQRAQPDIAVPTDAGDDDARPTESAPPAQVQQ